MTTLGVVGAGAAGCAAAWRALRSGARVHVFSHGSGATDFSSGLLDAGSRSVDLSPLAEEFLRDELEFVVAGVGESLVVATNAGLLRAVSGANRAVLDLVSLSAARVGVLGMGSASLDEKSLGRSLSLEPLASARGLSFEPFSPERGFSWANAASLRGFAERLESDSELRARVLEDIDARARELDLKWILTSSGGGVSTRLERTTSGVTLGEFASNLEGVAGLRFDARRQRLLAREGVIWSRVNVERWEVEREHVVVTAGGERFEVDGLILATGGWVGGGIEWTSTGPRTALRGPEGFEPPRADVASESGWDATRAGSSTFAQRRALPLHHVAGQRVAWAGEVLFPSSLGRVVEAGVRAADALLQSRGK